MKDVFDCNPEMTVREVAEWSAAETNEALADYLDECIERRML